MRTKKGLLPSYPTTTGRIFKGPVRDNEYCPTGLS